jgi:hypothetical protein
MSLKYLTRILTAGLFVAAYIALVVWTAFVFGANP